MEVIGLHHYLIAAPPDLGEKPPNGYIDHVAIACKGLPSTLEKLKRQQVPYRLSVVAQPAQVQVIVEDPVGTTIELNFRNESPPEG